MLLCLADCGYNLVQKTTAFTQCYQRGRQQYSYKDYNTEGKSLIMTSSPGQIQTVHTPWILSFPLYHRRQSLSCSDNCGRQHAYGRVDRPL